MDRPDDDPRGLLRAVFRTALAAADPRAVLPPHLPARPKGRTIVLGAGKAAAAMARAVEDAWNDPLETPLEGLVVTRHGHGLKTDRIEVVEADHPVPDARGHDAARRILALAEGAGVDDLVLVLISGGASALLTLPVEGLALERKQALTRALLGCGATISEINAVRRHLSAVKGGRLAQAAAPARVVTLAVSDVAGDDPAVIGSGPTVADPTTIADARAVLRRHGIDASGLPFAETPDRVDTEDYRLIATPWAALRAAASQARSLGVTPLILGDAIEGEARQLARVMAGVARGCRAHGAPTAPPCLLLSGGEATVVLRGTGCGGPNAEFALALALENADLWALAADTDGVDGAADIAGAMVTPDTLDRARALNLDPAQALADNDAHALFARLGDGLVTGPTLTNVNDFRAILVR